MAVLTPSQSLLVTCRLHDIDPYDYFVDVLQRVGEHPASKVGQLTPRCWKELFALAPKRGTGRVIDAEAPQAARVASNASSTSRRRSLPK